MKVLFVDDSFPLIEALKKAVSPELGSAIDFIDDLAAAREAVDQQEYDRIIADQFFEGQDGDGLSLLQYARSRSPLTELILISGMRMDTHVAEKAASIGALVVSKSAISKDSLTRLFGAGPVALSSSADRAADVAALILENEALRERLARVLAGQTFIKDNNGADRALSCFVSHATPNSEIAKKLYYDLQRNGIACWFAPEEMSPGDRIRQRISDSIEQHDKLLLILSAESISSQWVEGEVEAAFEKERRGSRTVLIPVTIDNAVFETEKAWASEIRRTRHIGDFTAWRNPTKYSKSLQRLLKALAKPEKGKA